MHRVVEDAGTNARSNRLQTGAAQLASDLLWTAWRSGTRVASLPVELEPASRSDGYAIQACLARRSRQRLIGWRIAATSLAAQDGLGVDRPLAGIILEEMVISEGSAVSLSGNRMRVAEPNLVFRLGADLSPRGRPYGVDEVRASVVALHIGVDVPDSRYYDAGLLGAPQVIADNACGHQFVLGPEVKRPWRDIDLSTDRVLCTVSSGYARQGKRGDNVLRDPWAALTWLANELGGHAMWLRAGQYVATGAGTAPVGVEPGDVVSMDFGSLGTMSLSFTA